MPNTPSNVRIHGFRIDGVTFECPAGGLTVGEACERYNIPTTGVTFILNGNSLPASAAASTSLSGGDQLEVARESKGGN